VEQSRGIKPIHEKNNRKNYAKHYYINLMYQCSSVRDDILDRLQEQRSRSNEAGRNKRDEDHNGCSGNQYIQARSRGNAGCYSH
jgi:hypothetical protein